MANTWMVLEHPQMPGWGLQPDAGGSPMPGRSTGSCVPPAPVSDAGMLSACAWRTPSDIPLASGHVCWTMPAELGPIIAEMGIGHVGLNWVWRKFACCLQSLLLLAWVWLLGMHWVGIFCSRNERNRCGLRMTMCVLNKSCVRGRTVPAWGF
jgi:hypothetical protein